MWKVSERSQQAQDAIDAAAFGALGGAGATAGLYGYRRVEPSVTEKVQGLGKKFLDTDSDLTDEEFKKLRKVMGREEVPHYQSRWNTYSPYIEVERKGKRISRPEYIQGNKNSYAIAHELGHATGPMAFSGKEGKALKKAKQLYFRLYEKSLRWGEKGIPGLAAFARQAHKEEYGDDNSALRAADYLGRGLSGVSLFEEGQASLRGALGVAKVQGIKGGLKALRSFAPAFATYAIPAVANHIVAPLSAKALWAVKRKLQNDGDNTPKL